MTIANCLTLVRLIVSPIFLLVYVGQAWLGISDKSFPYFLLFLFLLSEVTDLFDGYLARKFHQVTDFGKIFDPMADSVARLTIFLCFTTGILQLSIMLVFLFIYRDSVVSTLRTVCALKGFALAARRSGKIKSVIQAISIGLVLVMMIFHSNALLSLEALRFYSTLAVSVAALYALYSGVDYILANRHYLAKVL